MQALEELVLPRHPGMNLPGDFATILHWITGDIFAIRTIACLSMTLLRINNVCV